MKEYMREKKKEEKSPSQNEPTNKSILENPCGLPTG